MEGSEGSSTHVGGFEACSNADIRVYFFSHGGRSTIVLVTWLPWCLSALCTSCSTPCCRLIVEVVTVRSVLAC